MNMDDFNSSTRLIIAFEEDNVKAGELGVYPSKPASNTGGTQTVTLDPTDPTLIEMETISGSYLSAHFTAVQPLNDHKSLLILQFQCHPAVGYRFGNATITWRFRPAANHTTSSPTSTSAPKIVLHAPRNSVGGWTNEHKRLLWGVSLPMQVGFGGSSVGIEPSREIEIQKVVAHAMTIRGTVRGKGKHCVWTVEENESSATGIPSHFQLVVILEHEGPFVTELDVKAKLQGGKTWAKQLQSKKGDGSGLSRRIDVSSWSCGDVGCGVNEADWQKFVAGVTGEVPGVAVVFAQPIGGP